MVLELKEGRIMGSPLRIVHLEDDPKDAELIQAMLETEGIICHVIRVESQADFSASLEQGGFDLILADYTLPSFDGLSALKIALEKCPDVPFIFVSGTLGEEVAIEALKIGATDYVLKERLSRIVPSVRRALREAKERTERKLAEEALLRCEAYLAEAQRLSDTGSWAFNVTTRQIVHWSQEHFRVFGFDPQQGMPSFETFRQRMHPDDQARAADILERAVRERTDYELDCRIVLPDGAIKYIHAVGHPVFNASGDPGEFESTVMDVTERKRAEEERQVHFRFLESMDKVNRAVQGTNDLEQMMSDVLDAVLSIFNCDRAWLVYPCDPEAASWNVPMEHARPEFPGVFVLELDLPVDPDVAHVFHTVRASSGPVRFGPGSEHPLPAEAATRFSSQSMMAMAIYPKGDQPYMLGLHQCSYPRVWTPQEERLFQEIGRRPEDALTSLLMFRNLRESERKLEEAQRLTHVGYWERDPETDRITWSDETYRIFGLQPQARILNLAQLPELIHPEDKQIMVQAVAEALRGGRRYDVEYRVVRPNGEVRLVHSQGDVMRDESGRPRRMYGTVQDITERKRAEEELQRQKAQLDELFELSPDAIVLTALNNPQNLRINKEFTRMFGYTSEEAVGQRLRHLIAPDDLRPADLTKNPDLLAGRTVEREVIRQRKDGTRFHAHITAKRVRYDEDAAYIIYRDITERKRAEQRLVAQHTVTQILAEAATLEDVTPKILQAVCECLLWDLGALWRIDREAGVLRCVEVWHKASFEVPQFEAISRASTFLPGIGLPGRVWSRRAPAYIPDVVHDANFPRAPIAAREGLHAAFAFPILLGGDVLGVMEFFSHEIRQPDQDLLTMVATIGSQIGQFIERQRAEEALREAQVELAHVTRVATLGELTASIAHEINQPLGAVVNNASACVRWLATQNLEEARQSAALVIADGHRAAEIIARIRALAKRVPPHKDWLDLNATIRDVIALARNEVQRHGIALATHLSEDVPLILADRIQVQQVLLNLLMNAIEALSGIGEGPRALWVSSEPLASREVVIAVRDSGPGL